MKLFSVIYLTISHLCVKIIQYILYLYNNLLF